MMGIDVYKRLWFESVVCEKARFEALVSTVLDGQKHLEEPYWMLQRI
jgi:hypothetical protein